ncbi:MAG TPA: hypothetical protein VGS11_05170 [Candidatus Bathyarchaeia archaeon]|nr:hypothetical protein [Candidatus Bathyarchaeia archaeon]
MEILGSPVDRSRKRDLPHAKLEQELSTHSKEVWEVRKRLVEKDTYKKRYDCCPKKPKLLL